MSYSRQIVRDIMTCLKLLAPAADPQVVLLPAAYDIQAPKRVHREPGDDLRGRDGP
jgi:hypothetical protein